MPTKHAYLITAYDDFYTLGRLIRLVDDPRNDIYLHVDRKSLEFSEGIFRLDFPRVRLAPRRKVYWGDFTHVRSILELIKLAQRCGEYEYFHLLSGSDLPLHSQDYIHRFCQENVGKEFVAFHQLGSQVDWVKYAHYSSRYVKSNKAAVRFGEKVFRHASLTVQRSLRVDRLRRLEGSLHYGSDWFSITGKLANVLVQRESEIERVFKRAGIPSEFFVQTILWNSELQENVYGGGNRGSNMRLIDWERGRGSSPYVFRCEDYAALVNSEKLFARKFDSRVDKSVIDGVFEFVRLGGDA